MTTRIFHERLCPFVAAPASSAHCSVSRSLPTSCYSSLILRSYSLLFLLCAGGDFVLPGDHDQEMCLLQHLFGKHPLAVNHVNLL